MNITEIRIKLVHDVRDKLPALLQRYGIQGIPAVKAFRDDAVAAGLRLRTPAGRAAE